MAYQTPDFQKPMPPEVAEAAAGLTGIDDPYPGRYDDPALQPGMTIHQPPAVGSGGLAIGGVQQRGQVPGGQRQPQSFGAGYNTGYAGQPVPGSIIGSPGATGGGMGGGAGGGDLISVEESEGAFDWLFGGTETRTPEWRPSDVAYYEPYRAMGTDVEYVRGRQMQGLEPLHQAAMGLQPSVADLSAQRNLRQGQMAGYALASSARGGAGAQVAAQRQAAIQGRQLAAQTGEAGAIRRAQEMDAARVQYMSALNQLRAQDFARQEAAAREWARQQELMYGLTGMEMGAATRDTPGLLDYATQITGGILEPAGVFTGEDESRKAENKAKAGKIAGTVASGGAGAAAFAT